MLEMPTQSIYDVVSICVFDKMVIISLDRFRQPFQGVDSG